MQKTLIIEKPKIYQYNLYCCCFFVWMFQLYKTEQKLYWQPKNFETETWLKYIANISKVRIRLQPRQTRNPSPTRTSRSRLFFRNLNE